MRDQIGDHGAIALLGFFRRPADVNGARDPLAIGEFQGRAHKRAIGHPLGDPRRAIAKSIGRETDVETQSTGREHLLPLGCAGLGLERRHNADDERRAHEPAALHVEANMRWRLRLLAPAGLGENLANIGSGLAFEHDEAPGRQFLVVGDTGANGQDPQKLIRPGAWT